MSRLNYVLLHVPLRDQSAYHCLAELRTFPVLVTLKMRRKCQMIDIIHETQDIKKSLFK